MRITTLLVVLIGIMCPFSHANTPQELLYASQWGVGQSTMLEQLGSVCKEIDQYTIEFPVLPLARESESYLIAHNLKTVSGDPIDRVIYTFADDQLVMITASGGAIDSLIEQPRSLTIRIGQWRVAPNMSLVMRRADDSVTLLSEDAMHTDLFLWETPAPDSVAGSTERNATIPAIFEFGADRRIIEPAIKALCTTVTRETITPPSLPTQPKRQIQINAYGFEYMGAPRKVEAVFADDQLALVWILTGKGEQDRLRAALIKAYGDPIFVSDTIEAFKDWTIALRKDKPEILAIAPELVPMMKANFGG